MCSLQLAIQWAVVTRVEYYFKTLCVYEYRCMLIGRVFTYGAHVCEERK